MSQPYKFRHLNRIVGAFALAACLVLLGGVVLVGKARHWLEPNFHIEVAFPAEELSLLRPGLPVKILGENAGEVLEAHLQSSEETRATLRLRERFKGRLRADAYAVIHTPVAGLIGDTFVEVWPGQATAALPVDAPIVSRRGEDLVKLATRSIQSFGDASGQLRDLIAENRAEVQQAIINVRRMSDNLDRIVADNRELVQHVLTRLEAMGRQVSELIAENRGPLRDAAARLPQAVDDLGAGGRALAGAGERAGRLLDDNAADLRLVMRDLASAAPKVDEAAGHIRDITGTVARGEGSIGKLVKEDTAHDELVTAVAELKLRLEEVAPVTGGLRELRLYGGTEGGMNTRTGSFTAGVHLRLEPQPWKFYQGGVSYRSAPTDRDPTLPESPDSIPVDFTLMLGWRWLETSTPRTYWLTLAGGLVETRLGGYAEVPIWSDRVAVRVLARGTHSNRDRADRRFEEGTVLMRATATVRLWRTTWIAGGVDDILGERRGAWVGARLELLDNDLRNLTSVGGLLK